MIFIVKSEGLSVALNSSKKIKSPTQKMLDAGNYKKRRIGWRGMEIAIENEAGSIRSGTGWSTKMKYPYGYLRSTLGVDGDEFDCYVGPDLDTAPTVFVVDTMTHGDWEKPDEQKAMLGFASMESAKKAYLEHYDDPRFFGGIIAMPVAKFIEKVRATKEKPAMIKSMILFYRGDVVT